MTSKAGPLECRCAGILLHPTSLPGSGGNGDLGPEAYHFVDFLTHAGISVWQTLPHGPTHEDLSPYQCLSVHAGNPLWISLERLAEQGWLEAAGSAPAAWDVAWRGAQLRQAHRGFEQRAGTEDRVAYERFVRDHALWLEDFALYMALREENAQRAWLDWPAPLRDRERAVLEAARERLAATIERVRFEQFVFFQQWLALKHYANARGILLLGDMPIYVAHDSAEVWAEREQFDVDVHGRPKTVAGVPPDYFSATGQLWGNPHYDWKRMKAEDFRWWRKRLRTSFELYDLVRIDHFRGFEAYWSIPAGEATAVAGRWVKAPGRALFKALKQEFGALPLVAEDLGVITPAVEALRRQFDLPGMKILQFAFGSGVENPYLPHNHEINSAVFTGTHDNNTTVGWYAELSHDERQQVLDYLGDPQEPMPWPLIRAALASVARLAVIPLQDALGLDASHRMNTPATAKGNWKWRFSWDQFPTHLAEHLRQLVRMYGREVTSSK